MKVPRKSKPKKISGERRIQSGTTPESAFAEVVHLIESARQGNRDWLEVGRRWAKRPTDATGIYDAIADAVGNTQQRTIALSREWFEDVVETQRENRQLVRQSLGDAREAVERAGARVPQFLRRNRLVASRDGTTSGDK